MPEAGAYRTGTYRLQPGDQVAIRHRDRPDYESMAVVAPDGTVSVPGLPAPVPARGLAAAELAAVLDRRYEAAGLTRTADTAVLLLRFANQVLFVGGEVRRPGVLRLPEAGRTAVQALMSGGGPLPTADLSDVLLFRPGPDGREELLHLDLARVLSGKDLAGDVPVGAMDVMVVPKTGIARFDVAVDQYVRQVLPAPAYLFFQPGGGFVLR